MYGFPPPQIGYGTGLGAAGFGYNSLGVAGAGLMGGPQVQQQSTGSPFLDALMNIVPGIAQTLIYKSMLDQQVNQQLMVQQQANTQWQNLNARIG